MTGKMNPRVVLEMAAIVAIGCVLCLHDTRGASPPTTAPGGPSAIEQRAEMIAVLKDIRAELRQLNQFRQTGSLPIPNP